MPNCWNIPAKKKTVSSFAADVIGPRVRDMDTESAMDPAVISALFERGLMGVEAPEELGGEFKQKGSKYEVFYDLVQPRRNDW